MIQRRILFRIMRESKGREENKNRIQQARIPVGIKSENTESGDLKGSLSDGKPQLQHTSSYGGPRRIKTISTGCQQQQPINATQLEIQDASLFLKKNNSKKSTFPKFNFHQGDSAIYTTPNGNEKIKTTTDNKTTRKT